MSLHSRASIVIPSRVWKLIWKLRVPAKIKHFMWKSLHGALPTMSKLSKKRSMPYPNCPICHNQDESVEHLLLFCPWVEPIWFGGALNLRIVRTEVSNWMKWFLSVSNVLGGPNDDRLSLMSYIAFSCWHIWKARCNFVYNNNLINPTQVLWAISNSACAFFKAVCRNTDIPVRRPMATPEPRWATPPLQYTKINVDASWSALTRAGFVGIVLRDAQGSFVAAIRHAIKASCVNAAEAMAISMGCEFGLALGLQKVIVESDSQESICSLSVSLGMGRWETFPSVCTILDQSRNYRAPANAILSRTQKSSPPTRRPITTRHVSRLEANQSAARVDIKNQS
ncbi:hypothetical protein ACFX2I_024211 [Malus domestica]